MDLHPFLGQAWALAIGILRLGAWLAILATIFVPLERLFAGTPGPVLRKAFWADIGFYFLSSLVSGFLLSLPLAALAWAAHALMPGAVTGALAGLPVWAKVALGFVIGEIGFYWGHRWSHEIPFLWRFHAVHHSAEHIDWLVNTRLHPVDMVFTRLCGLAPLYVLGLGAPIAGNATLVPLLIVFLGTLWGFFLHANLRWRFGPLEHLIATPAFHHWHHTNDGPEVINKNYASMLPLLDRVFGTLYLPRDRRPERFGIDEPMPDGLVGPLLHPLRPATAEEAAPRPLPAAPRSA